MIFSKSKILSEGDSLAEQLRKARTGKKLTLAKAAEKININPKYLAALEASDFGRLPAGVYGKKYLSEYALFLGLNQSALLALFESETGHKEANQKKELFSKQIVTPGDLLSLPKILRNSILALIVIICLVFLASGFSKIIAPPKLVVSNPPDNLMTEEHSIEVIGASEPESQIIINGEALAADSNGQFDKKINLKSGLNTITITAQKKYGRSNTVVKQILVE